MGPPYHLSRFYASPITCRASLSPITSYLSPITYHPSPITRIFQAVPSVNIAVLASGKGSNLQALLDALATPDSPGHVALVVSHRDTAPALTRAKEAGITTATIAPDGQDSSTLLALFGTHRIGLVVLAGWLKHLPADVIAGCRCPVLNVHPALLPAFGGPGMYGRKVHEAVLTSGARVSGPTVHLVDEQYDHGRILAQWPVPVRVDDTPETLAARVLAVEHRLLPCVVRACAQLLGAQGGGRRQGCER